MDLVLALARRRQVGAHSFVHFGGHADRFAQRRMRVDRLADIDAEMNPSDEHMEAVLAEMRAYAEAARNGNIDIPQSWTSYD